MEQREAVAVAEPGQGALGEPSLLLMPIVPRQCALNTLVSRNDNKPQQCCSSWPDTRAQARWTRRRCWRPRAASEEGSRARGSQPLPAPRDWQTPGARAVTTPGPPAGALPGLSAAGSPAAPCCRHRWPRPGLWQRHEKADLEQTRNW